jgi:hypothetical protein
VVVAVPLDIVFLWYFILPVAGLILLAVTPILLFWLYFRYFHKTARKLNSFIRRKQPIAIITYDTGKSVLVGLQETRGEGIVRTTGGRYKILPRPPKKTEGAEGQNPDELEKLYSDLVLKRTFLEDTGVPLFFGYSGKICLLNPDVLALAETASKLEAAKNCEQTDDGREAPPITLLDPRKIKNLISGSFTESQALAIVRDTEEIMREELGSTRKYMLPIMTIIILMFVAAIVMKILGLA